MSVSLFFLAAEALPLLLVPWFARRLVEQRRLLAHLLKTPSSLTSLPPGTVLVRGKLTASEPVHDLAGHACVWVHRRVTSAIPQGMVNARSNPFRHDTQATILRAETIVLTDATGACTLDLTDALLEGRHLANPILPRAAFVTEHPTLASQAHEKAATITWDEQTLRVGDEVTVLAPAHAVRPVDPDGYREVGERPHLSGSSGYRLLLTHDPAAARQHLRTLSVYLGLALAICLLAPLLPAWLLVAVSR